MQVAEIIIAVKEIKGGLTGISRLNLPLFQVLTNKLNKLESGLASMTSELKVEEDCELTSQQVQELVGKFEQEFGALEARLAETNDYKAEYLERIAELETHIASLPKLSERELNGGLNNEGDLVDNSGADTNGQGTEAKDEASEEEVTGSTGAGGKATEPSSEKEPASLGGLGSL